MKYFLYAILISSLLVSCRGNKKAANTIDITASKKPVHKTQSLILEFKPIIEGVWIKKDYIEKVIKSKSPIAAVDLAGGITIMSVRMDRLKGDSVIISVAWNNHEGGDQILRFRPGKKAKTILLGDYDLGYSIKNGDTTLVLYDSIDDQRNAPVTFFEKAPENQPREIDGGLNYLINKNLVSGKYKSTDSLGVQSDVVFTEDGKVKGLSDYKSYYIQFDLSNEPMSNLDEINFDLGKKNTKTYSYKIKDDTITLYDTHPDADSTELILGKRVYKLVKQH